MLSPIFEKFADKNPISVMARGMMERVLNPSQLNQWFNATDEHPPPEARKSKMQREPIQSLKAIQPDLAGIDLGSREHWVAGPPLENNSPNVD